MFKGAESYSCFRRPKLDGAGHREELAAIGSIVQYDTSIDAGQLEATPDKELSMATSFRAKCRNQPAWLKAGGRSRYSQRWGHRMKPLRSKSRHDKILYRQATSHDQTPPDDNGVGFMDVGRLLLVDSHTSSRGRKAPKRGTTVPASAKFVILFLTRGLLDVESAKENHEENQALISAASRGIVFNLTDRPAAPFDHVDCFAGFIEPARGTAVVRAENVHISGGSLTSAGRDVHNHIHFHQAPKTETPKVDLMAALESIDNFRGIQQDTLSKATPDTGKWVFDNDVFPRWRDPKSDVKTMWGSGMRAIVFL
ncbi:hypothetical protein BKA70DRAFT_1482594 [Coprinopsis sp. MPI-PUGE-AT-0042]|nr:hypothetical protein BKA70DRAFT_1482594 [Coprinopsis sp. MPI-PUGE-AT-0042]